VSARANRKAARKYPTRNKDKYYRKSTRRSFMDNRFIRAEEVAAELDVSKPYAYKLIRQLNEELKAKGFLTIAGRVNRQYFNERFYGTERKDVDASL
jgi:hypothetical protein